VEQFTAILQSLKIIANKVGAPDAGKEALGGNAITEKDVSTKSSVSCFSLGVMMAFLPSNQNGNGTGEMNHATM
jgi:hypothetical protein